MTQVPELEQLLTELAVEEEETRLSRLLETCQPLGQTGAGPLLRSMLSSPDKWQRDLAADVANEMGFDPFVEEDQEAEAEAVAENILTLGFDESMPSAPPVESEPPVADSAPDVRLVEEEEDTAEAVTFLGPCVDPQESGGEPTMGPATIPAPGPMVWVAIGLVALAGIALFRYLASGKILP